MPSAATWMHLEMIVGEGDGTPLQCSCLENPRDGGAWWAAISEVTQSRTQLKRLSSSSSSRWSLLWKPVILKVFKENETETNMNEQK